jgi:hypothetical protein
MARRTLSVDLEAVIVAVTDEAPRLLTVEGDRPSVPSGPLDPDGDLTLDRGLRRWVCEQTGLDVGYVEQLYTFGDRDRVGATGIRLLSIGYLALAHEERPAAGAAWRDWYEFLPWEDHRGGRPGMIDAVIAPALRTWAQEGRDGGEVEQRRRRSAITFGLAGAPWDGVRVLERYELLYEAGLVAERYLDSGEALPAGLPVSSEMNLDHRRILATGIGRLRGKLTYRPVVFELLPETFTLSRLQRIVEAMAGTRLHTQNFRRLVDRGRLVEAAGAFDTSTGGRPAELFRFRREVLGERPRPGVGFPGGWG